MSREISHVTLRTLPDAVRQANLQPDEEFTILIESKEERRARALKRMREISAKVTIQAQADGIVTDEDVERFLAS